MPYRSGFAQTHRSSSRLDWRFRRARLGLRGAGDKAVSGTDISQFRAFNTPADATAYEARMDRVIDALEDVRVPTIAALQGACTGGGAGIAAACDLRVGAPSARFGFPIARTLGNTLSTRNFARLAGLLADAVGGARAAGPAPLPTRASRARAYGKSIR